MKKYFCDVCGREIDIDKECLSGINVFQPSKLNNGEYFSVNLECCQECHDDYRTEIHKFSSQWYNQRKQIEA